MVNFRPARMLPVFLLLLCVGWGTVRVPTLAAAEEPLRFLEGLREREYFDTALFYLEQQQQRTDLDPELADRLEYERAALLLDSASQIRNPTRRQERLDEAAAALARFVNEHPDHPQVGAANRELAKVHLNNARVALWEAESSGDEQERNDLRKTARAEINQAREIFRTALPQLTQEYGKFPPHVDPEENETQYREKKQLEQSIINSRLELAKCTYEEAQSYPENSPEFREHLSRAIDEFELLHFEFRSQTGGHYARLWQGKCYEELGELTKALGIYAEIMAQPQSSPAVERLQDLAEEFRLICLNHSKQAQYELVIEEANYWLNQNRKRRYSTAGIGILWQRAVAYEKLALNQPEGSSRRNNLRQALNDAEEVQRYPGRNKGKATQLARRLSQQLRGEESAPEDFASALDQAQQLMNQLQDIKADWDAARAENAANLNEQQAIYEDHLARTRAALEAAENLRDNSAEPAKLAQLFYYRAFIDYLTRNSYAAAVRAEYVAHRFAPVDSEMAQRAALLATASFSQALSSSTGAARAANIRMMEKAANYALKVWPKSDMAANCCQLMGQALTEEKEYDQAAEWYFRTPSGSSRQAHNQVLGGQALWQAYLKSRREQGATPPTEAEQKQLTAARQALLAGVNALEDQSSNPPLELITGKATLAEMYSRENESAKTIELLTAEPASVTGAIADVMRGESDLPLSPTFSGSVYRLLLKAYVTARDIESALTTMKKVEELNQQNDQTSTVSIYVQLGKELERELNDLEAAGEKAQTAQMRQNFQQFLEGLYAQQEGQSFSSLFWIAETYASLANSLPDKDSQEGVEYFNRAKSAYESILNRDTTDPDFITDEQQTGIKLRLAAAQRELGEFDAALAAMTEVVEANPNSVVAQFEAASLLQAKGMADTPDASKALEQAIQGTDVIWGWTNIIRRLQQMKTTGKLSDELIQQYYESRLKSVRCRQRLAELAPNPADKVKLFAGAEQEIVTFFSISGSVPDEWYLKFNQLYVDLRSAQQKPPENIADRLQLANAPTIDTQPTNEINENVNAGNPAVPVEDTSESKALSPELMIGLVAATGALLFLVILFFGSRKSTRKRKQSRRRQSLPEEAPQLPNGPAQRSATARTGTTTRPRPTSGTRPAAPRKKPQS
ncbi:MAG: hypothetical protein CMJ46_07955 [Planctomyces sp.]|nr:hypothetical protein [Planctomyces sp.]